MKITEVLQKDAILLNADARNKSEAISILVESLGKSGAISNVEQVRKAVLDREQQMATGIGHGVAMPHCKTSFVASTVAAFARLNKAIDFQSYDDEPVSMVFLLVCQENNVGAHLKLISRISKFLKNDQLRIELSAVDTPDKLLKLFYREEQDSKA